MASAKHGKRPSPVQLARCAGRGSLHMHTFPIGLTTHRQSTWSSAGYKLRHACMDISCKKQGISCEGLSFSVHASLSKHTVGRALHKIGRPAQDVRSGPCTAGLAACTRPAFLGQPPLSCLPRSAPLRLRAPEVQLRAALPSVFATQAKHGQSLGKSYVAPSCIKCQCRKEYCIQQTSCVSHLCNVLAFMIGKHVCSIRSE